MTPKDIAKRITEDPNVTISERWGRSPEAIKVYCHDCSEWLDESIVEITDISEGPDGRDLLTFICPKCHQEQTSKRIR